MASTLERIRTLQEDIEASEQQICDALDKEFKTHRERMNQQHQIARHLENIREKQVDLQEKYKDQNRSRKEEINAMGGEGPALFSLFYDRFQKKHYFPTCYSLPGCKFSIIA